MQPKQTNVSQVDTSSFALNTNLANLKTEIDKLNIEKSAPLPVDLSKLSNVVKNDVVKKIVHDKSVATVDNIDTGDFVLKTKYNTDKTELENKIPDVSYLVTKTKLSESENKIPDISNLTTKTALTTVEIKYLASVIQLKKQTITTKITEVENKLNNHNHDNYIDASEFNKLAADVSNAKLAQANLITKRDFDAKLPSLNIKITQIKSKHLLVENELNKLKNFWFELFYWQKSF